MQRVAPGVAGITNQSTMRHGKKLNHLGRKSAHRRAMMSNLAASLILHKRINTTLAKAKALRTYIEPLVTKAKANTTHARRTVFSYIASKEAVQELFSQVREKVGDRPGGYVRVIRTGFRAGDGAETALIEFVDFNSQYSAKAEATGTEQKRRTRRGKAGAKASSEGKPSKRRGKAAPADAVEEFEEIESEENETEEESADTDEAQEEDEETQEDDK